MRVLISFLSRNAAGGVEKTDKILDVPVVTIGRATDQILHLKDRRARLEHAEISQRNGDVRISSNALAGVTVNNRSTRDAVLQAGDIIEVGANVLRIVAAPDGVDIAMTFELRADASQQTLEKSWTSSAQDVAGLSKRKLAWTLAGIVFVVALLLPGLSLLPSVAAVTRSVPLVADDGFWSSGPLHGAHSSTAVDCNNCHQRPFQRVPDSACQDCHTVDRHVSNHASAVLGEIRCASCHLEHEQPAELVNRSQRLCGDCHADGIDDVAPASDFLDAHADFSVTLLAVDAAGDWRPQRQRLGDAQGGENSNLKFDHAAHLNPDGIVTPDGKRTMQCKECHQPEPGGQRMLPIEMQQHCSGCHALSFDADSPERVVPHGDPQVVLQTLVEYYSARLLGEDRDAPQQRLRRPGQSLTRVDRDRAAAEARSTALEVAADLFERRACVNCHEVQRNDDDATPWTVVPVKLTSAFMPHANFSHAAHASGDVDCGTCHAAADSASAHDVLMPGIDTCRDCHGSGIARRNTRTQIPSTCIVCHSFHAEQRGQYP